MAAHLKSFSVWLTFLQDLVGLGVRDALDSDEVLFGRERQALDGVEACLLELFAIRCRDSKFLNCYQLATSRPEREREAASLTSSLWTPTGPAQASSIWLAEVRFSPPADMVMLIYPVSRSVKKRSGRKDKVARW
ncbi:hypothetical protein FA10DRAFT_155542 [Acaromyces ingoldii]|uniref:Uncharacterized protein n=1 Tax=Acaromyces ingoldii TaxID=215250 RepID=A0A316YHP0_9BASI|nr:hypothetical protein FA10DRAFT_155542 [Acaromyces ingoldii]PWN88138.1 hypothetical protein FA10DRAFT_155542 [Acaromyces ingoldii]